MTSWLVRTALCGVLFTGCNPTEEPTVSVATSTARASATTATPQVFVVDSERDSIDAGSVVLFTLDFAQPRRTTVGGDHQLDSVHPLPGTRAGCDATHEAAYLAAMGNLQPRDTGYVSAMQVVLTNATSAPDAATRLCFGVHTRAGGWAWRWNPLPITIDRGTQDFSGQSGAGHFDLAIDTADVDAIALMLAYGQAQLSQLSYTALPASR